VTRGLALGAGVFGKGACGFGGGGGLEVERAEEDFFGEDGLGLGCGLGAGEEGEGGIWRHFEGCGLYLGERYELLWRGFG